jgi:phosphoenolpyruvate synthase/pyruvate phosphate dikinase
LLANIEMPEDAATAALAAGAVGVGLFRSEFLFMGRHGKLPDEEEQYQAYRRAVEGMQGLPVTIRTSMSGPTNRWTSPCATMPISTPRWACAPFAGAWLTRPCS